MSKLYVLYDDLYVPEQVAGSGALLVEDGRVVAYGPVGEVPPPADVEVVDTRGFRVIPGLIDLQLNGGFGHDFTADPSTIWDVAARIPRFGVTTFLPTVITSSMETYQRARQIIMEGPPDAFKGATTPGLHIEGPFLSEAKRGAHKAAYFRPPTLDAVAEWTPACGVRLVTLAPEVPGALEVIRWLVGNGVVVSGGHTNATYDEAVKGFDAGIRYGTHLFNAMSGLHHRQPGMAGALLSDPRLTVGLIPDGIHIHPALIRIIWRVKGPGRIAMVSDAMGALGMQPGTYSVGEYDVTVDGTSARLTDGRLAGSILTQSFALRNLVEYAGCSLVEALPTMTTTPARLIGLPNKGEIRAGWDADITVIDDSYGVLLTIASGEVVWRQNGAHA